MYRFCAGMLLIGLLLAIPSCRSGKSNGSGKPRSGWFSRVFGGGSKSKKETSYSQKYGKKEIDKVIQTARSYRGTPHRDGGVNRYGIDCSALIMLSFESAGLKIPRTARQQAELGRPVQKTELRPGDLVFFADRKIGSGITHVGLVTEITAKGEVQFIHTSSKLGVTENLLSTSYFTRTYAKAVRPF